MKTFVFMTRFVFFFFLFLFRRKSQQAEREYEKVKHQLQNLEESVRDRCKKEFTGTSGAAVQILSNFANASKSIYAPNQS